MGAAVEPHIGDGDFLLEGRLGAGVRGFTVRNKSLDAKP
jgi:hypothetical protein